VWVLLKVEVLLEVLLLKVLL